MKLYHPQIDYLVDQITSESPTIARFRLIPAGEPKLSWQPGQYLTISFYNNRRWSQERSFSILNADQQDGVVEIALKQFGPYTKTLAAIQPGDLVRLSGPYGSFGHERQSARRLLFLAGGIGITPLLSMLKGLADEQSQAEITLVYASKAEEKSPFAADLAALTKQLPHLKVQTVTGTVTPDILLEAAGDIQSLDLVYLCGPGGFMAEMTRQLRANGLITKKIKTEAFTMGPGRLHGAQFWTAAGVYIAVGLLLWWIMSALHPSAGLLSWYQTRATALTAGLLLSLLAVSGIALTTGLSYRFIPPLFSWTIHKAIGLSLAVVVILHLLTVWQTPMFDIDLGDSLLPFTALKYALGTITLYGVAIIVLTSLQLLPSQHRAWKVIHFLSYLAGAAVFAHAWLAGTDMLKPGVRTVWWIALISIIIALIWRMTKIGAVRNGLWRHKHTSLPR